MRKEVYAVRVAKQSRLALDAAAISAGIKPRTLAALILDEGLQRRGYLPRSRRTQATAQA